MTDATYLGLGLGVMVGFVMAISLFFVYKLVDQERIKREREMVKRLADELEKRRK